MSRVYNYCYKSEYRLSIVKSKQLASQFANHILTQVSTPAISSRIIYLK